MSGYTFRPKIKDADYYMDAIQDLADHKLGTAKAPVLVYLHDEELAAKANSEHDVAGLLNRIRMHLVNT